MEPYRILAGPPPRVVLLPPRAVFVRWLALALVALGLGVLLLPGLTKIMALLPLLLTMALRIHVTVDAARGELRHGFALGGVAVTSVAEPATGCHVEAVALGRAIASGSAETAVELVSGAGRRWRLLESPDSEVAAALVRHLSRSLSFGSDAA